jgi:hypothetical protein
MRNLGIVLVVMFLFCSSVCLVEAGQQDVFTNLTTTNCTAKASGTFDDGFRASNVIDGIKNEWNAGEWATNGQGAGAWVQLRWTAAVRMNQIIVYSRPNSFDMVYDAYLFIDTSGDMDLTEGASYTREEVQAMAEQTHRIGMLGQGGSQKVVNITAADVRAIVYYVTEVPTYNRNTGLAEIECYMMNGDNNTAIGNGALYSSTTGNNNTATGFDALRLNTTGNGNTANGYRALYSNTTGNGNTANGYRALYSNTANYNAAYGHEALYSNTTGGGNTACGFGALRLNTTGGGNTACGWRSLHSNIDGDYNTAIGHQALLFNRRGGRNIAIGYQALYSQSYDNTGIVWSSDNVAVGYQALYANQPTAATNGENNVAVGSYAGDSNTTGYNNTFIGYNADASVVSLTNATAVGNGASVTADDNMVFGDTDVVGWGFGVAPGAAAIKVGTDGTNGNGATLTLGGTWTNASDISKKYDIRDINYGLKEIMQLHPVTYKLKELNTQDIGFIAQEVKPIISEVVYGKEGEMTLSYGQLTSVLTKAVQEQQKQIEEQNDEIKIIRNKNKMQTEQMKLLKKEIELLKQKVR